MRLAWPFCTRGMHGSSGSPHAVIRVYGRSLAQQAIAARVATYLVEDDRGSGRGMRGYEGRNKKPQSGGAGASRLPSGAGAKSPGPGYFAS